MNAIFTIDGQEFHVRVANLRRKFRLEEGVNSFTAKSGVNRRDLVGTYYDYVLDIDPDELTPAEYDRLYEILSSPQDTHTATLPYGQSSITFDAQITSGEDSLIASGETDGNLWDGLSIIFRAQGPKRRPA